MEIMDLYDDKKRKLDKTMAREDGEPSEGEFRLSVHVWILNEEGKLLIQKRNENLKRNPGKWGFTGGAVDTNETSLEGAIRETEEELGIKIEESEIEFLLSFKREKGFVDVWLVKKNIDIQELVLHPEEVVDAKWVSLNELKMLIENGEVLKSVDLYLDIFEKLLKRCHNLPED